MSDNPKKPKKKASAAHKQPSKSPHPLPIQRITLDKIDPSPLNRDARDMDDLLPSIRKHGVIEAIKLRPKGDRYEIVYGERRYRASVKLKLPDIPATVEDLSDAEAHELRCIENACRRNAHPLEDAEAWETLLTMRSPKGEALHTAESIAKLIGCSPQHVYQRLKLTALGPSMREAFYAGHLTTTTAFLIARAIPPELQEPALATFNETFGEPEVGEPFPSDELAELIDREYLTRLDRAPFALKDTKLVPGAGACTACPKRSGNQVALFADATTKEVCTDLACFHSKLRAHRDRLAADVVARGGAILSELDSNKIYRGMRQLPYESKHVDLDSPCLEHASGKTWRQLLGDLSPKPTLATDAGGIPHALVLRKDAIDALTQAGVEIGQGRRTPANGAATAGPNTAGPKDDGTDTCAASGTDVAAMRAAARQRHATIANILADITAAAASRPAADATFAKIILETMTAGGYHDAISDTVKRRDLERAKGEQPAATLATHAQTLDSSGLRALILELAIARGAYFSHASTYPDRLVAAASAFGIDIPSIERKTVDELAAKAAKKAKTPAAPAAETPPPQP